MAAVDVTHVWIDTDPAIGLPGCDVDDGLALVQAFHSPELVLHGVSVLYGNAPLVDAERIARDIVTRFGPPGLPVAAGAREPEELGRETDAVRALAAALRTRSLAILALGPPTNVATLVQRHPELVPRISFVVCVAGRRPGQRFVSSPAQTTPFPDLNFECDPTAMQVLLDSPLSLTLAPWEVSSHVWIDGEDLDALASSGPAGVWLAERSREWLAFWRNRLGAPGFNPFDTLAVACVTHPALIESMAVAVRIVLGERGPDLVAEPRSGRPAIYCTRPSADLKRVLLERLAGR